MILLSHIYFVLSIQFKNEMQRSLSDDDSIKVVLRSIPAIAYSSDGKGGMRSVDKMLYSWPPVGTDSSGAILKFELKELPANTVLNSWYGIDNHLTFSPMNETVVRAKFADAEYPELRSSVYDSYTDEGGLTGASRKVIFSNAVLGDVDNSGAVKLSDALYIARGAAYPNTLSSYQIMLGDINDNSMFDVQDLLMICQYIAGNLNTL